MTDLTPPTNTSALSANVNMPTREEVAYRIFTCTFSPLEDPEVMQRIWSRGEWPESNRRIMREADAVLALFKPAIAAAEKRGMERAAAIANQMMIPCDLVGSLILDPYTSDTIAAAIREEMEKLDK